MLHLLPLLLLIWLLPGVLALPLLLLRYLLLLTDILKYILFCWNLSNFTSTDNNFLHIFLSFSSTQICESAGECLSDRGRGHPVHLFHSHYSFTTNQAWQHKVDFITEFMISLHYSFFTHFIFVFDRWLKDGKEMGDQQKFSILNDSRSGILTLTIISATEADIGQYECEVLNLHL